MYSGITQPNHLFSHCKIMTQHSSLLHFRVVELMVLNLQTGGNIYRINPYFCTNCVEMRLCLLEH